MLNDTPDMALFLELFTKELILHSGTKNESQEAEKVILNRFQKEVKAAPTIASKANVQEKTRQNPVSYRSLIAEAGIKQEVNLPKITVPKEFRRAPPQRFLKVRKTMRHQRSFLGCTKIPRKEFSAQKIQEIFSCSEKSEAEKNFSDTKIMPSRKIIPSKPVIPKAQKSAPKIAPKVQLKRNFTSPIKTTAIHVPSQIIGQIPGMEVDLGKLNIFVIDKGVTVIECPGQEKFVLVKKTGRVNLTNIKLSQEDINSIISAFSEKARIPLMDGVFKAIIGELSINAIVTDSLCSRFMIYKKNPYSFIYQQ